MKTITLAILVLALAGPPAAMAQMTPGPGTTKSGAIPEAPIGHRQPRASEVPNERNLSNPNEPVNKEDAILDKKIKSICRGC